MKISTFSLSPLPLDLNHRANIGKPHAKLVCEINSHLCRDVLEYCCLVCFSVIVCVFYVILLVPGLVSGISLAYIL